MGSTDAPCTMKKWLSELPESGEGRCRPGEVQTLAWVEKPFLYKGCQFSANCDILSPLIFLVQRFHVSLVKYISALHI